MKTGRSRRTHYESDDSADRSGLWLTPDGPVNLAVRCSDDDLNRSLV